MRWVEQINVEYGDCTVLGGSSSILMVDFGSMNHKLRKPEIEIKDVYEYVMRRYEKYGERFFLLTHYHRDHFSGFFNLISNQNEYFDKVYLPYVPQSSEGESPILEYALLSRMFLSSQTDIFQYNSACLNIFKHLGEKIGYNRIYTLKQDDEFYFDGSYYKVLNPPEKDFYYSQKLCLAIEKANELLTSAGFSMVGHEFIKLKERFILLYYKCLQAFSVKKRELPSSLEILTQELSSILFRIDELKIKLLSSNLLDEMKGILSNQTTQQEYSSVVNSTSMVFHNIRKKESSYNDILMTGDVQSNIIDNLYDKLYPNYYILKAPHHGTESGFSHAFNNIEPSHILISSGDYDKENQIFSGYQSMQNIKHCTNNTKCEFYKLSGACCNRLNYCYDLPNVGLSIKCPKNKNQAIKSDCKIYVVTPTGSRSCLCDT